MNRLQVSTNSNSIYKDNVRCDKCEKYYKKWLCSDRCPECNTKLRTQGRNTNSKRIRELMIVRI